MRQSWIRTLATSSAVICYVACIPSGAESPEDYDLTLRVSPGATVVGGTTVSSIGSFLSINNSREVAFAGLDTDGNKVFLVSTDGTITPMTPFSPSRSYSTATINDAPIAQVSTRDRFSGPTYFIRRLESNQTSTGTVIGRSPTDFDSGLRFLDINNSGTVAFAALVAGSTQIALFAGSAEPPMELKRFPDTTFLRPQIASDGQIVIRDNLEQIQTWSFPSGASLTIAGPPNYVSAGEFPGISDDGRVVAFTAVDGNGPGIFASIPHQLGRAIVRVANTGPNAGDFESFSGNQRVAVSNAIDLEGVEFVRIVFAATVDGTLGIYSTSLVHRDLGPLPSQCETRRVAQVGDAVGNLTIQNLSIYDPLNAGGDVAFWATFSSGQGIVVAEPRAFLDCVPNLKQFDIAWKSDTYAHHYDLLLCRRSGFFSCADDDKDGSVDEDAGANGIDEDLDGRDGEDRFNTIGRFGCVLTACADAINYFGMPYNVVTDPLQLNDWLKTNDGYANGTLVRTERCAAFLRGQGAPMFLAALRAKPDDESVDGFLRDGSVVIGRTQSKKHSVIVTGNKMRDGTQTYEIHDPGYTEANRPNGDTLLRAGYGNRYQYYHAFSPRPFSQARGPAVVPSYLEFVGTEGVDFIVIDPVGRRTGFDPLINQSYNEIPNAGYERVTYGDPDDLADDDLASFPVAVFATTAPIDGDYTVQTIASEDGIQRIVSFAVDELDTTSEVIREPDLTTGEVQAYDVPYDSASSGTMSVITGQSCMKATGRPVLNVGTTSINWSAVENALSYDVVQGTLGPLRAGMDYSAAVTVCLAEATAGTTVAFTDTPALGEALFVLTRARDCVGPSTFDSAGIELAASRDLEIRSAPMANRCAE